MDDEKLDVVRNLLTEDSYQDMLARIDRIVKHLKRDADSEVLILKTHLLVEEIITEILTRSLQNDNPLGIKVTQNMMFAKKLDLCWALNRHDVLPAVWEPLKKLNLIRNKMAHSLEPKGIDLMIEEYIESISKNKFYLEESEGCDLYSSAAWLISMLGNTLATFKLRSDR